MQKNYDWSSDEFFIGRFPGIGKSLSTTPEARKKDQQRLDAQKAEYFAKGGTVTYCPAMTLTTDEELEAFRKQRKAEIIASNVERAA